MGVSQKIREIMIPLGNAATATVDAPLREVIPALRKLYCEVEEGKCTEAGFRAILVMDKDLQIVGILDFRCILEVLIPEIAGNFLARAHALWDTLGAVSRFQQPDEAEYGLKARMRKNAEKRAGDFMLKIRGRIDANTDVLEALMVLCANKLSVLPVYEGDQPVGVVRDSDLFLKVADIMRDTKPM